eukprot:jgi/Undpi1/10801/HiC_scaffold_3.g01330.m1
MRRARGSGPGAGVLAAKPRDLERFIDNNNYSNSRSNVSSNNCRGWGGGVDGRTFRTAAATSYEPSISWDGLALDPRPFARFDEHDTLALTKKPVGSAGVRVIELEGHAPGGVFGRPATGPGRIQWTVEQETSRVLAPDNPFAKAAADGGGVVVERPYFNSTVALVPKIEACRPPTCMPRAGPQGDGALLTPEERRLINNYETKMQSALRVGRKARHQKTRLDFIMRHRYPEGSIGVDSSFNPRTEVHAERRSIREAKEARHRRGAPHEEHIPPAGRGLANSNPQCEQQQQQQQQRRSSTFINVLGARERFPKSDPRVRSQLLWDEGAGRRSYNVVSGVRLPLPTEMSERPPGRLAHPSQQSLERGRNLQGSLAPA